MKLEDHIRESVELFGKPFEEVHRWLDELAGQPGIGMGHRKYRHHEAGLTEVERLFGMEAVEAARQHIVSDLKEEGWREGDRFPRDRAEWEGMGLF